MQQWYSYIHIMPNWCDNTLIIKSLSNSNVSHLDNFYNENSTKNEEETIDLDFNCCVPMPEKIKNSESPSKFNDEEKKELINKYGTDNWYDWAIENWGTKWNTNDVYFDKESDDSILYSFTTAWGPPDKWLYKIFEKYPNLDIKLTYEESGMDFGGEIHYDGQDIFENQYTLSEYVWENCDKDLIDKTIDEILANYETSEIYDDDKKDEIVEQIIENISDEIYNSHMIESYLLDYYNNYLEVRSNKSNIENFTVLKYSDKGNNIFKLNL